ncbi:MAG: amidohydrolase [Hyphomonadaceae bacterium]|nr:amidohydrolase [Hyphomonadaceae bacterium]
MPVINRIAAMQDEVAGWRQDFHAHPEIGFDVHRTAGIVADKLRAFGCDEVVPGMIRGRKTASDRVMGLRADMDALPIHEATGVPYASNTPGKMHACGHDGHTSMLLGAAKYLCETRNFDGTVVVIFQPNEEGLTGGLAMLEDGLIGRFGIQELYGMHTWPGPAPGTFGIRPGPLLAAADRFTIEIAGKGAHAMAPHTSIDPVIVAAHTITALQTIAARNVDPLEAVVVSTCMVHAGDAFNIIPERATLTGTVRTLSEGVRDTAAARLAAIAKGTAATLGASATVTYERAVPVTINDPDKTKLALQVAREVAGTSNVLDDVAPTMGAEDFAHMLKERPGAYILIGNGPGPGLHTPGYNFNDAALPFGISYLARLAETGMPA